MRTTSKSKVHSSQTRRLWNDTSNVDLVMHTTLTSKIVLPKRFKVCEVAFLLAGLIGILRGYFGEIYVALCLTQFDDRERKRAKREDRKFDRVFKFAAHMFLFVTKTASAGHPLTHQIRSATMSQLTRAFWKPPVTPPSPASRSVSFDEKENSMERNG